MWRNPNSFNRKSDLGQYNWLLVTNLKKILNFKFQTFDSSLLSLTCIQWSCKCIFELQNAFLIPVRINNQESTHVFKEWEQRKHRSLVDTWKSSPLSACTIAWQQKKEGMDVGTPSLSFYSEAMDSYHLGSFEGQAPGNRSWNTNILIFSIPNLAAHAVHIIIVDSVLYVTNLQNQESMRKSKYKIWKTFERMMKRIGWPNAVASCLRCYRSIEISPFACLSLSTVACS